jgi:hypothetical protein
MIVISNSIDSSSSGLVLRYFLLDVLKKISEQDLIIGVENSLDFELSGQVKQFKNGRNNYHNLWQKIILILFGISIIDYINAKKIFKEISRYNVDAERVIIFVTGINFFTLYFAHLIFKNNKQNKLYLHFLDPLVSINGWGENKFLRTAKMKLVKSKLLKLISDRVYFSTTNRTCSEFFKLQYQLPILPKSFISYNVSDRPRIEIKIENKINLYYRGTFNEMRGGKKLLNLLNKVSENNPEFNFIFQGNMILDVSILKEFSKITFLNFSLDDYWLKNADILLDIDLCKKDVFISGKFYEYLQYPKPILVISPMGSAINNFILDYYSNYNEIKTVDFDYQLILEKLNEFKFLNTEMKKPRFPETPNCILDFIEN